MTLNLDKSNWKRVTLGEVIRHITDRVDPETSGLERFLAGEHIPSRSLTIKEWGVIGRDPVGPQFFKRFKPGHVLYLSRRTYLRKTAVPDFTGICGEKTFVLETLNPEVLSQEFLPFVMSAERFHTYAIAMSRGSVNPYINWGELKAYEFDLPPLDEQKRIADLLWALENHKQSIALGAVERVEKVYLEGLLAESVGELMPISSMGSVLMGRQRSPIHATGDHMMSYLRVANVGDNKLRLEDVKQMNFTPEEQERYDVRGGDILVSEGQSRELVGQSVLIPDLPERMCFQNTLIRFRADHSIVRPEYAQALFRACLHAGIFASIAAQTTSIAHLGVQRFAQLQVRVPSLHEQDKAMAELTCIQTARESSQAELSALVTLSAQISRRIFGTAE